MLMRIEVILDNGKILTQELINVANGAHAFRLTHDRVGPNGWIGFNIQQVQLPNHPSVRDNRTPIECSESPKAEPQNTKETRMLVLSRKPGQSLIIRNTETGEPIAVITLVAIEGNRVRIGVNAPLKIEVLRDEHLAEKGDDLNV